jgi:hypothetical protein
VGRIAAPSARLAFTLIELLAIMAGLGVAIGLLTTVLWGAIRLEKASAASLQTLISRQELADQFRADVAHAEAAPPRWKEHSAGPTCLVLRLDSGRHVLYLWDGVRLVRSELVGDTMRQRELGLGRGPASVEFRRAGPGDRLLTLRLATPLRDGRKSPSLEITAALGGDLQ